MQLYNVTIERTLVKDLHIAGSLLQRMKGLLGARQVKPGYGMLLTPCNGIHTFGMRIVIDVITLDRQMRVARIDRGVRPYRVVWPVRGGHSTLEIPTGAVDLTNLSVGDQLRTQP